MKMISGLFAGTGAIVNVCLGFIPDWVRVRNVSSATVEGIEWNKHCLAKTEAGGGFKTIGIADNGTTSGKAIAPLAVAAGVSVYRGTGKLAAASTAHKVIDDVDRRAANTSAAAIATYTKTGTRTGKFNAGVNTDYVGAGSKVWIKPDNSSDVYEVTITAMTNDGDADNEITLSEDLKSGSVMKLTSKVTHRAAVAGDTPAEGFTLAADTDVNASGELVLFEAGTYQ